MKERICSLARCASDGIEKGAKGEKGEKGEKGVRRGSSILEVLVAIAVSGTILWGAGTLTVSLLHLRAARRIEHDVHRSLLRLQQQWRTDVRAATQGGIDEKGARLSLRNPAGNGVAYHLKGNMLLRTVDSKSRLAGRDEYRLPEGSHVRWLWPAKPGAIATLAIDYPAHPADPRSLRTRTLEAVVGADRRLAGNGETHGEANDDQVK